MQENNLPGIKEEQATDVCLQAMTSRFERRGLAESARLDAERQQEREARTGEENPLAYRLSGMSDAAVSGIYRRGKETMNSDDLLRYAGESRAMRIAGEDFSADTPGIYETAEVHGLEPAVCKPTAREAVQEAGEAIRRLPAQTLETVKTRYPLWFDPRKGSTENEKRRFPLSAFAAVAAVAVSMMLIVASSLMVIGAETQISRLNSQITDLHGQITDLQSELAEEVDLFEIRRIAVEELGMVSEDYVKMDYIELKRDEIAEVTDGKSKTGIGLAGLLSAIGLK